MSSRSSRTKNNKAFYSIYLYIFVSLEDVFLNERTLSFLKNLNEIGKVSEMGSRGREGTFSSSSVVVIILS
jgi:hypothetical protein